MDEEEKDEVYGEFYDCVNMAPKELEEWLQTEESRSVGQDSGDGEAVGHKSGKRIVEIKRTKKDALNEDEYAHMRKVVGYIHRHLAQEPSGDVEKTPWRYSLMNWGHDPLKS